MCVSCVCPALKKDFFSVYFKLKINEQDQYITDVLNYSNYPMWTNMIQWYHLHLQTHDKPEEKPAVAMETEAAVAKPAEPVVNMQGLQKLSQHPQNSTYIMHLDWEDVCRSLGKTPES